MSTPTNDPMIAALLRERAGYLERGLEERVAAVDEQLKVRGYAGEKPAASPEQPERRQRPKSTAERPPRDKA